LCGFADTRRAAETPTVVYAARAMTNLASRTALVVEDDPSLQLAMVKQLEKAGFQVLTALDFDAAVRHLSARKPDIACIDLGLPSESGYELCEHIRSQPHLIWLPILVTSERSFPEDMAHAEEAGANAFLKKPFTMNHLLDNVNHLLDGPLSSRPGMCRLRLPNEP
jgi:DNA-binding response OmpR family regulator